MVALTGKDGLDLAEKKVASFDASVLRSTTKGSFGRTKEEFTPGNLVLTQNGLVFLEMTGLLGTSSRRSHSYSYEEIKSISIESRGVSGSLSGHVFLSVSCSTPEGLKSLKYYMYEEHANKALDRIDNRRLKSKAPEELKKIIHRLVKPKGQANLRDVAMDSSIRPLVEATRGEEPKSLSEEAIYGQVMDVVATLILDGQLEGVITDDGEYVSNVMLARKTVQYQVVIDFNSLYSQLQGKGIVLQNIECPSCNAHLDYPESGSVVVCKYCGSTVNAVDIFEKFKNLL